MLASPLTCAIYSWSVHCEYALMLCTIFTFGIRHRTLRVWDRKWRAWNRTLVSGDESDPCGYEMRLTSEQDTRTTDVVTLTQKREILVAPGKNLNTNCGRWGRNMKSFLAYFFTGGGGGGV